MSLVFPRWTNWIPWIGLVTFLTLGGLLTFTIWYWFSPKNTDVGYMPEQPIAYSHRLHAGELGIDCRYCHQSVDKSAVAGIPSTETCMRCHKMIKANNPSIQKIAESFKTGKPIPWVKVHSLPDFAYFDHSRHVRSGVSCVTCHGRIDQMDQVHQVKPLSMAWCLDCHRNPQRFVSPTEDVTNMVYQPSPNQQVVGPALVREYHLNPKEDCSTCHR